ncbi:hypothetical protein GCM10010404_10080 [Nonomuraea africana]
MRQALVAAALGVTVVVIVVVAVAVPAWAGTTAHSVAASASGVLTDSVRHKAIAVDVRLVPTLAMM